MAETTDEKCKVLLVDDDPVSLTIIKRFLANLDIEIFTARDGFEAVELAQDNHFAVAVLDVSMPGMNGFETAQKILSSRHNSDTPVLFATAINVTDEDVLMGYSAGAVDYLLKPLVSEEVLAKVGTYVKLSRQKRIIKGKLSQTIDESIRTKSLLEAARSVLETDEFETGAQKIFDAAKKATGATAGYVALFTAGGREGEILFLDSGGQPCTVDKKSAMSMRGFSREAYSGETSGYDNNFPGSQWVDHVPDGHVRLDNVLFAPLTIAGKVQGVIGLANKPGDFTDDDAQLAGAFGNLAALSLKNSRHLSKLKTGRKNLELAQRQAGMGSFSIDHISGTVEWSEGMYEITGTSPGRPHEENPFALLHGQLKNEMEEMLSFIEHGGEDIEKELKDIQVAGGRIKTLILRISGERDSKEVLKQTVGSCLDLTEQTRLNQKLMASQRLEAVGQLVGGIAHEVNTPLQYMASNLDYIRSCIDRRDLFEELYPHGAEHDTGPQAPEGGRGDYADELGAAISDIEAGLNKISSIVSALRQMIPAPGNNPSIVEINAVIKDLITVTEPQWHNVAKIKKDLCAENTCVSVSQSEVYQALLNILINAIQALRDQVPGRGRITVTTRVSDADVSVSIADNGPGIPKEFRDKIFDPFFSSKEVGEGTGLGLALARSVIQRNGGTIDFETKDGAGTTFILTFPAQSCSDSGPGGQNDMELPNHTARTMK